MRDANRFSYLSQGFGGSLLGPFLGISAAYARYRLARATMDGKDSIADVTLARRFPGQHQRGKTAKVGVLKAELGLLKKLYLLCRDCS
jgi:hypothetical protein